MATVTKKRSAKKSTKGAKKSAPRKKVASASRPSANGKKDKKEKTAGQGDFATEQKLIDESIDERIQPLEDACQKVLGARDKRKNAKADEEAALAEVGRLIHEHDLNHYKLNGNKFYIEPGAESVKVVKVKQNG